jgi:predicted DNA-binding ribbon-helix-helix protein
MRNLVVAGRRTSVRLEPVMWEALHEIARRRNLSVHRLATEIDEARSASSLTAAIRVYIVDFYRAAAAGMGPAAPQHAPVWARTLRV